MQLFENPEPQLNKCIFAGPSLCGVELDRTIMRFGPAQLGSIYLAAKSGYKVIGLVDAYLRQCSDCLAQGNSVCHGARVRSLRQFECRSSEGG